MRSRKRTIAFVLVVLAIAWGMLYAATVSSQGGRVSPLYSTYRYDASGTAALRELFEAHGLKVSLLQRGRMRAADHGVLFQVLPMIWTVSISAQGGQAQQANEPPGEFDSASLLDWVGQGNTLVRLSRNNDSLLTNTSVAAVAPVTTQPGSPAAIRKSRSISSPVWTDPADELIHYEAAESNGKVADVGERISGEWNDLPRSPDESTNASAFRGTLELSGPGHFWPKYNPHWRAVCVTANGTPLAFERHFGRGRIIVIRSPTPALNGALTWSDNAAIMLSLAGDGPVLFDEWSHGQPRDDSVMGMIYQVGLWPVLLQAMVALLLYVWSTAGYRRIDPPAVNRRPSSHDQVRTLGYLYGRSLSPGVAATRIYTEVLSRIATAERCSPSQVQARLAASRPEAAQRLQRILADVASAAQTEGPTCAKCGYALAGSVSEACPDCGTPVPPKTRERIAATPVDVLSRQDADVKPRGGVLGLYYKIVGSKPNPSHLVDDILARALTDSHQLALEITRGRRNPR